MRVFVLNTGRCGSLTFAEACKHLTNCTVGHETNARELTGRLDYPDWHIEVDCRLAWFLGQLGRRYPSAFYVHLTRDADQVVESFVRRWERGPANIIRAFGHGIVMRGESYEDSDKQAVCRMYLDTVTANIEAFLATRDSMRVSVETIDRDFPEFLYRIGARGDLAAAVNEWAVTHNATREDAWADHQYQELRAPGVPA